ncbi:MAG: hypothetical protein JWQ79_3999 [Mucilaginibacter sp.]|jgi:hypothetical protein|nr:hypothetical protein [Mucilaginibacter sp.]
MELPILIIEIIFGIAVFLLVVVMILSFLKSLKKDRFPNWKFLDYFSVGYVEHLYTKYILRK